MIPSTAMKCLSVCIVLSFILMLVINVLPISLDNCNCENHIESHKSIHSDVVNKKYFDSLIDSSSGKKKLAVIVPHRDRFDELLQFVPHMDKFLNDQNIPHHIFVVNQADRFRFNRASLINVGFLYTKNDFDYIAMHDVDLLPLNKNLKYEYPKDGPFHVAAPGLHPKYNYPKFIGGILLLKNEDFEAVNGMSNKYWGWGLEDDEFYVRLMDAGMKVTRPVNLSTGRTDTFRHFERRRDHAKCFDQKEATKRRDTKTGLDTLKYSISDKKEMSIDGIKFTLLNVKLECDKAFTPWCDCSEQVKDKSKKV